MADKIYKIAGEFQSVERKSFKDGSIIKYAISYKQPRSKDPSKVWVHQAYKDRLSEETRERIRNAKPGDMFTFHQGKDGAYPYLVDITDIKDAEEAKKSSNYEGKGQSNWQPKDETGIAVGAAWTNAIQIYGTIPESDMSVTDAYLDQVSDIAWRILQRKLAHEEKLRAMRAGKQDSTIELPKATDTPKPKEPVPTQKVEDLDDIDW